MAALVEKWDEKDAYGQDMSLLSHHVWPLIKDAHIAHDSYCCEQFPCTYSFPTKRPSNFQHVGQVFGADDQADKGHINRLKDKPAPEQCRRLKDWVYG